MYILFVLTLAGGITTAEFNDTQACYHAASEARTHGYIGFDSTIIDAWCVKKGDE